MGLKKHWSFRYVFNRVREFAYRRLHPNHPWLTPDAIRFLDQWLNKEMKGMELGSGRSTIWIAQRIGHLISMESHESWYDFVRNKLQTMRLDHVSYLYAEVLQTESGEEALYLKQLRESPSEHFDFVLVDGEYRVEAAILAITKVKRGGLLIVDNINWFLPSTTHSPASRGVKEGCLNEKWESFYSGVNEWKLKWTSNGVTDTALFFKPE